MKQYLIDTFDYNDWANRQTLKTIQLMPRPDEAIRLFSHLITSQNKWLARIKNDEQESHMAWFEPPYPFDELEARWEKSLAAWLSFLDQATAEDLEREIRYVSSDGNAYSSAIRDIALQLNYHSIHHRAQISLLARQQDITPQFLDYIAYSRIPDPSPAT